MPDGGMHAGDLAITLFYSFGATRKTERRYTWAGLRDEILRTSAPAKDRLPWLKLARFGEAKTEKGSLRHDANVIAISGIEADYDGGRIPIAAAAEMLVKAGIKALVYTSPSHTVAVPRWRVLCPVSTELPPDRREHLVGRLNGALGGILAGESFTLSQAYYFGAVHQNPDHVAELIDGQPIDLLDELDETWTGRPATKPGTGPAGTRGKADVAELLAGIVTAADFHPACTRLAGVWASSGVAYLDARHHLRGAFDAVPEAQRDGRWKARRADIDRVLQDIYGKQAAKREQRDTPPAAPRRSPIAPRIWSAVELMDQPFDPIVWTVREMLPAGYAVLAGAPKLGKSWFCYQLAAAVASGADLWGNQTEPGDVLNLALEDGERRAQDRLTKVLAGAAVPPRLQIATAWPRLDEGGLEQIEAWARSRRAPRLVILDTFQKLRPPSRAGQNAYEGDYQIHGQVQSLATALGISIVAVTHFRKSSSGGDWVEAITGSTGISGAADTLMALKGDRGKADACLHITGRDVRDVELALQKDGGPWRCLGDAAHHRMGETRQAIRAVLASATGPLTPAEVAQLTDMKRDTAKKTLVRMAEAGQLVAKGGRYALAGAL